MRRYLLAAVTCFGALGALAPPAPAEPLPIDQRNLTGTLENGLKWIFRSHDNPPGKMALMICVPSGSLNETEAQRGLAHFTEHMAFNGTEHFAPGELLPYFESIGMEFGSDLNAGTGFEATRYMLFIPSADPEQIDQALMVLSDYVFRALLPIEEIDKERGVIMSEKRAGKGARQRIRDKLYPQLFAGSRFAERMIIGEDEVIEGAPRSEFVDYYRTWYRPETMTLILIGDTDSKPVVPLIEKWFGQYQPDGPSHKPHGPEFGKFTEQRAIVVTDPELASAEIRMSNILPGRPPTTTVELARVELVEGLGSWIIGRRFEQRIQKGEATYQRAYAAAFDFFKDAVLARGSARGEPADWAKMIEELVMEVSRARDHGFTERELALAKKELIADAERAVRTEPTRNARYMLFGFSRAVIDLEPISSAEQELEILNRLMPSIQLSEVSASFADNFKAGTFAYTLSMPEKEGVTVPGSDEVLAAARAALARKTSPPQDEERPTELLASMPTPGKVVESATDQDLRITSAWLNNGVRVHHRYMDYKKDSVWVSISLAGGTIEETSRNAGITEVAALAFDQPATGRLASSDITDIMTGKNISVGAQVGGDTLTVTISGSPKDLETGLQLAHVLLTDGKIEESAFKNWKQSTLQRLEAQSSQPMPRTFWTMMEVRGGGDPRLTANTPQKVEAQTVSAGQQWLNRLCKESPIEVAVVGEIELEQAMSLLEKYVGSLPKRRRLAGHLDALRKVNRPAGPYDRRVEVRTMTPQGMALFGFMSCDEKELLDRRALSLASQTLDSRTTKRIREELGLVYSLFVHSSPAQAYPDTGTFWTGAPCDPGKGEKVLAEAEAIFKAFAESGPTPEELENAKKQVVNNLDVRLKEPRYWWSVLQHLDLHKKDLNEQKNIKEYYQKLSAEQVRDAFAKYYTDARIMRILALPVAPEPQPESETKQPEPAGAGA